PNRPAITVNVSPATNPARISSRAANDNRPTAGSHATRRNRARSNTVTTPCAEQPTIRAIARYEYPRAANRFTSATTSAPNTFGTTTSQSSRSTLTNPPRNCADHLNPPTRSTKIAPDRGRNLVDFPGAVAAQEGGEVAGAALGRCFSELAADAHAVVGAIDG